MEQEEEHIEFFKNKDTNIIDWIDNTECKGEFLFTFDKQKIYNLFADYPHELTEIEKRIFDKENPYWRKFFANRSK
jgi:hypothetical protein